MRALPSVSPVSAHKTNFLGTSFALQEPMRSSFILSFLALTIASTNVFASTPNCSELFGIKEASETWEELYKRSDLSPRPQLWLRIRQGLQKSVSNIPHPLQFVGQNADKIGQVYKDMSGEFPMLRELITLSSRMDQGYELSHSEFIKIKHQAANQIIQVARRSKSNLQTFGALEALKILSFIETRVVFPKTKEQIEEEKQEKQKEKEKEKQKQKKDKKEEDEEEQDPKWNKLKDKYKPENKDIGESGGKQKNVDLVLTNADLKNPLLRQKLFDQFNLNDWNSVPSSRQPIQHESSFSKKLILNPLGESSVGVPVPYGYTLIPGKYKDHAIIEQGPGEFDVVVNDKKPVTIGLAKIQKESYLPSPPTQANANELNLFPAHLLMFSQSLKGKPALQAAAELEKYISDEGGFLYYSTGDQIDKEQLNEIDKKYSALLQKMPKPMAMANAGAFNCDGAAWIGAILLRDVLNIPVRIAGGRTTQGQKTVDTEKLFVVKSSSPAHAWIEVYDNGVWVPFDMTPKHNTPNMDSSPTDVDRDQKDQDKPPKDSDDKKDQKNSKEKDDAEKEKDEKEKDGNKDGKAEDKKETEKPTDKKLSDPEIEAINKQIEDLINSKSTTRQKGEANLGLVERLIKRNELMLVERVLRDGYQTPYAKESEAILQNLVAQPKWKNMALRSAQKLDLLIQEVKFIKFPGIQQYLNEVRADFSRNHAREGKQKLVSLQKYILTLSEYRPLTKDEVDALVSIEQLIKALDVIKHKNSKEFDVVETVLKNLPGNISKEWMAKTYGKDLGQLGSDANIKLAKDFVESGKLKPLLQMAALREFVDMTLDATTEPTFRDVPTMNRSIVPQPQQDLIVTRNPLDFAKMLWDLRPGEPMFAPTVQGRQFAIGYLETERVVNPKLPIEKKVSVVYYDVSPSMDGEKIQSQDSLLMAYVDKALSEVDEIGRPVHEIYLKPFHTFVEEGVHIATREDALAFLARRMNMRSSTRGGTDIQAALKDFYDIISASHKNKSAVGREKLFQRANLVLFTDGGSAINVAELEEKRKTIPKEVNINMNFVAIGDASNDTLKHLAQQSSLSTAKPAYRELIGGAMHKVTNAKVDFDPNAFATTQNVPGRLLMLISELIKKMRVEPVQQPNLSLIDANISKIRITKQDVRTLPGLREVLNLTQLEPVLYMMTLDAPTKQRLLQAILESYPELTGRSWADMTYQEKEVLERLKAWSLK